MEKSGFKKYLHAVQGDLEAFPLDDQQCHGFVGIGGNAEVKGTRKMNVGFELWPGGIAVGEWNSTELKGGKAPLLLSISDQRKLGLIVELGEDGDKVFSKKLNGLLGIYLLPPHVAMIGKSQDIPDDTSTEMNSPQHWSEQCSEPDSSPHQPQLLPEEPYTSRHLSDLSSSGTVVDQHYLEMEAENHKVMTKGQKKMVEHAAKEVQSQDLSLWSMLSTKTRTPLPKGCSVFLMEVFAGAAVLSHVVAMAGYPIATPVDILSDGSNLLDPKFRQSLEREIDEKDPYLVTFAPVCGPWSAWSKINCSKSEATAKMIYEQRDAWHPTLKWITSMIQKRLSKGRKVLTENPWTSELWSTLCFDKLIQRSPTDAEPLEPLELVRADLCEFGLRDEQTGLPHYKPTGFLTASKTVKERLNRRCSGLHTHQQLEGGQRTKKAQQWSKQLCEEIFRGFEEELQSRSIYAAFQTEELAEQSVEEDMHLGTLDNIQDEADLAPRDMLRDGLNNVEMNRQEALEELPSPPNTVQIEVERKRKWLRAPRPVRVALRRLHNMTGHSPSSAMVQLLRTAGASSQVLEATRHFACETCRKQQPTSRPNVVKAPSRLEFNHEIAIDCFEIKDSYGNRHTVLSVVCVGTLFHQAYWVAGGGVPKSAVCPSKLLKGWFGPFGAPRILTCDRGVHNRGRLQDLLRIHGVQLRYVGLEAPYQLGRGERQGGILKTILKAAIEERNIIGVHEMEMLLAEAVMVKNCRINHSGFTPAPWVLGKLPIDRTDLTHEEADGEHLGVQSELMSPEDEFTKTLEIRQAAKVAFAKVDSSRRVLAALLRKAVPLRGPYSAGDLVCFHRRDRWHGPCRVIGKEGRSTYWLVHGGVPLVVPEASLRPASSTEVISKNLLELRPSRQRVRDVMRNPEVEHGEEIPFGEDLEMPSFDEEQAQPAYVDLPVDLPVEGAPDTITFPATMPLAPVPEVGPVLDENMEEVPFPEQPESEMTPSPTTPQTEEPPVVTAMPSQQPAGSMDLTAALRRSTDALDGHPQHPSLRAPPGLSVTSAEHAATGRERDRSSSPPREPATIPVPDDDLGLYVNEKIGENERKHFHCFLAKRYAKKNKMKAGAGREIFYDKCTPALQEALQATRLKEWNNWKQFKAVKVIPPEKANDFINNNNYGSVANRMVRS